MNATAYEFPASCNCGTQPEWGGEPRPDNGRVCWDCGTFTCTACFAKHEATDAKFADRDLCIACNNAPEAVSA